MKTLFFRNFPTWKEIGLDVEKLKVTFFTGNPKFTLNEPVLSLRHSHMLMLFHVVHLIKQQYELCTTFNVFNYDVIRIYHILG